MGLEAPLCGLAEYASPRARLAVSHPRGAVHDCLSRREEQAARSAQPAASALSPASMSAKARVPHHGVVERIDRTEAHRRLDMSAALGPYPARTSV